MQIAPSGPDSKLPVIFYSLLEAIGLAKKRVQITSPYFISGESLMDALIIAAKSGIEIKLLIPRKSDSIDNDIQQSGEINSLDWISRPKYIHLYEKVMGLLAPIF